MRDQMARRRIVYLEGKIDRLESIIENFHLSASSAFNMPALNATCTVCHMGISAGMVCQNKGACPHGLDEEE